MADFDPDTYLEEKQQPPEPGFDPDAYLRAKGGHDFSWSQTITDIPHEIATDASKAWETAKQGLTTKPEPGVGGALKNLANTAKGLAAIPQIVASPVTGAYHSIVGHGMANLEHLAGTYINPELAAKDDPEKMYETAKGDVDTAMAAARPAGAPVRTPTGAEIKSPLGPRTEIEWKPPATKVKSTSVVEQPDTGAFFDSANQRYNNMRGYGVEFDKKAIGNIATDATTELEADGYRDYLAPKTYRALDELRDVKGQNATVSDIDGVRRVLNKLRSDPAERDAAATAISHIDDYLTKVHANSPDVVVNPHFADRIAEEAQAARSDWGAAKRSAALDSALERAETGASVHGNIGHQIQLQLKNLRNNKREMKFWTDAEKQELDAAIKGTTASKMAKQAGKFSPHGIVSTVLSVGAGHALVPGGQYALPAAGFVAKKLANFMARGRAENLGNVVRGRSALGKENVAAQAALPQPPPRPSLVGAAVRAGLPKPHRLFMDMRPQTAEQTEPPEPPQPPATAGFARGGNVNTHSRREILPATGSSGKVKAEAALPNNHQLGMVVPRGGSSCGSCRFLKSPTECGNKGFVKWNGGRARLPAPKNQYCCDLYESRRKRAEGGGVGEIEAKDFGDRFFPGYVGRVRGEVSPLATPLYQKARGLLQDRIPADFDSRWNPGPSMDIHKAEAKPKGYAEGSTVEDSYDPFAAEKFLPQGLADISAQTAQKDVAGLRAFPSMQRPDTSQEHVRFKTASPLVNITDEDIDRGMNVALSAGPGMIKAYHGSPHNFNAFDSSKIGTGEGAQAYGHGLYFAEHEPVAQQYRDQLKWKGANFNDPQILAQNAIDRHSGDRIAAADNLQSSLDSVNRFHRGKPPPPQAAANANTEQAIALLRGNEQITGKPNAPGKMYEVNINADPEHFLDWDKPLAMNHHLRDKIAESAQAAFDKATTGANRNIAKDALLAAKNENLTGQGAYQQLARTNTRPGILPEINISQPDKASELLREAGIPGIKYLDQGSRSAGEGSRNYVVFNDKLIDILRKYGITGAPAAGIMASMAEEQNKNRATGGRINDNNAALKLAYQVKKERGHHEKFKSHG